VAEAGGAFRANGSLENIFEFLLVKAPRDFLLTGSSSSARPKRIGAGEGDGDQDLAGMDYTKLTVAELANGISQTEAAIRRCREILDDSRELKTAGMQAVREATRNVLPKLEEDLKALRKAYTNVTKRKPR
jgi:hypothetical protein